MWQLVASVIAGAMTAFAVGAGVAYWSRRRGSTWITAELRSFFGVRDASRLQMRQKTFPQHMAPDAKRGLDQWLAQPGAKVRIVGVPFTDTFMTDTGLAALLAPQSEGAFQVSSVEYESYDVGDGMTAECPRHALWLIERDGAKLALLWTYNIQSAGCGFVSRLKLETGFVVGEPGGEAADQLLHALENAVNAAQAYRGCVLSMEGEDDYRGNRSGLTIHRLRPVSREGVILPESTLILLERNVVRFVEQRAALKKFGAPARKGLLFYGPPGTGKTHTIHYLIGALRGHTTLLITAEQIKNISEYMTLARMLQPCIVVIEDVDLIARHREESGAGEQSVLNRLLNEMDGLKPEAEVIFVLTTNRPEVLEAALAARPGRIDQAIEFPLPDAQCRERLMRLYAYGATMAPEVMASAVKQTEGVSASFIKELMRRAIQFNLECRPEAATPEILQNDVDQAIDEMLWSGGPFNRALLGAGEAPERG